MENPPSTPDYSHRSETREVSEPEEREPKRRFLGLKSDPFIFLGATGFIVVFVIGTILLGESAQIAFASVADSLMTNLSWLYIGGVSMAFLFLIGMFVSRYGRVKLGDDDDEPDYSLPVWFSMLFAGGLGATLMFWGVAEPINHAYNVPMDNHPSMSQEAVEQAFAFTFYHFGIHMWVIMALPGLALGYFIYKRKLPPRLSSIFAPLLGGKIYAWPGKLVDILAIIGTTFGIAVSVGLGVLQINAGMNMIWGTPLASWVELLIILFITVIGCLSVASGLDKGIKMLSNINIGLAVLLMLFILVTGPFLTLMKLIVESFGIYADTLPELMFWVDSFNNNPGWQGNWTVFYWAWSICWSPYVGMFIARISRGRTVREFIAGVLFLPTLFVIVWFAVFGRAGIEVERENPGLLTERVVEDGDVPFALFGLLAEYPLTGVASVLALAVIIIFFITSIDSAALVNDMFATGEENQTPTYYRVGWAIAIGAVTGALLLISPESGIATLQEVVIIVALPFFLMQFVMMYSLVKGMVDDASAQRRIRTRQWEKTDTPEKLEEHEARPAPGFDEEGNELGVPVLEHDEDGNIVIPGNVVVGGDLGVVGDMVDQDEAVDMQRRFRIVEQSKPRSRDEDFTI
ncbi:BCCT family transporter [Corynebacterium halotolerans]|uniref:Ectoine/proline/glycine betaine transporter EctP n=1 Tax=Corynebacterium halotolerans YIM 70093 = DSM 44683 TaxID=1121362 RepID=M1P019_9CORY|nr:BCCT family transporter [Corynebacterium halotolerans]AGF73110.1 ectoine/proline/glycine betaine transporter EctP [Corynebacterium halotolerans YIM 70093 = DSM 44683]